MTIREKFETLKAEYTAAGTDEKRQKEINQAIHELMLEDPDALAAAVLTSATEEVEDVRNALMREKLEPILPMINLSYIAKTYFNKSNAWFIQRVNGYIVNGKRATFKEKELKTLQDALSDMADKIKSIKLI